MSRLICWSCGQVMPCGCFLDALRTVTAADIDVKDMPTITEWKRQDVWETIEHGRELAYYRGVLGFVRLMFGRRYIRRPMPPLPYPGLPLECAYPPPAKKRTARMMRMISNMVRLLTVCYVV